MEKDFDKDCSDMDHSPGENEEDQDIASAEAEMLYTATILSLQESVANKEKQLRRSQKEYNYKLNKLKNLLSEIKNSQVQTSPSESDVSEIRSSTDQTQITEDACKNLPFTNASTEISGHLNTFQEPKAESKDDSTRQSFEKVWDQKMALPLNLTSKTSDNASVVSGSYTDTNMPPDCKMVEPNEGSKVSYFGKGKEAANKAFRYKKGSPAKHAAIQIDKDKKRSSSEPFSKKYPVKSYHETFSSKQSETLDTQSSNGECARTSPAIKRKGSDCKQRYLYETCGGTSTNSKMFEVQSYKDDSKISKKLKSEDDENVSKQTALPSNKNSENTNLTQFMDQPQTEETINEREQLYLQSTRGLSTVGGFISNSEEASLASGSNVSPVEREKSPFTSESDEMSASGNECHLNPHPQSSDRSQKAKVERGITSEYGNIKKECRIS